MTKTNSSDKVLAETVRRELVRDVGQEHADHLIGVLEWALRAARIDECREIRMGAVRDIPAPGGLGSRKALQMKIDWDQWILAREQEHRNQCFTNQPRDY